jgi:hypothetical protein
MVVEPISTESAAPATEASHEAPAGALTEPGSHGGKDALRDWSPAARTAMRAKVIAEMPRWYSPVAHFAFPALCGLGVIAGCAHFVRNLHPLELLTIPLTLLFSNAVEWHAHRDVLHKRSGLMPILYERHTPVHHKLFTTVDMAITDWRELRNVMLPAFGVLAILSMQLPLLGLALFFGLRNVALLFMATSMAYVLMYEWLHLAYHLPVDSFIGRRRIIRWLARHHALHHDPKLMQRWNMNVTVPLWDWLSGTIYDQKR